MITMTPSHVDSFPPVVIVAPMPIEDVLKAAIQERLKTQTRYKVAKDSDVHWNTIDRWMDGKGRLSLESAERLCKYLGFVICPAHRCKDK